MRYASAPSSSGSIPRKVGPPSPVGTSSVPDTTDRRLRRTALERPVVVPVPLEGVAPGYAPTDAYVRRFWIPILGPGAVADLCRLAAAATSGRPLKLPVHVGALARRGLVTRTEDGGIAVATTVRPLSPLEVKRLPPSLRLEHTRHRFVQAA